MGLFASDRERAVEITSHMIASCIHHALATKRMTVGELKERITDWDAKLIESILLGVQPDCINCKHLADLSFILGFDWSFNVRPIPQLEPEPEQNPV